MTRKDERRLERLYPALSARERAVLVLRAWKEGKEPDIAVRFTMPHGQAGEFNRLLGLLRGVNDAVGGAATLLREQVETLSVRHAWLMTLHLWGMQAEALRRELFLVLREPVAEDEYRRKQEEARRELLPVAACAELLAERRQDRAEGEQAVTDEAWGRAFAEAERELRALAASGALEAQGAGARLRIRAGSLYDWLGEPVPVLAPRGGEYEVAPEDEVAWRRGALARVRELVEAMPRPAEASTLARDGEERSVRALAGTLVDRLREGVRAKWQELRALEVVLEEVRGEFEGEDPAPPAVRGMLDNVRAALLRLQADLEPLAGPIDLPRAAGRAPRAHPARARPGIAAVSPIIASAPLRHRPALRRRRAHEWPSIGPFEAGAQGTAASPRATPLSLPAVGARCPAGRRFPGARSTVPRR
ncbi:MAG TPA: hypothetical protein VNM43_05925 [Dehalococcoidia bacterium]|nr:hypothetical protein [Dehalococcoidia bacterium]